MDVKQIYHKRIKLTKELLKKLTEEELLDLKILYDTNNARIGVELDLARGRAIQLREFSDSDWFAKTTFAKRIVGQLSQRVQAELSRRKREMERISKIPDHSAATARFAKELINAMTILLAPGVKNLIVEAAKAKCGNVPFDIE